MFKEIRRKEREMDQETSIELLHTGEYGVLSLNEKEGYPYGVPLSYAYLNGSIYFHCALEGHKLELLHLNNKASFCVVGETNPLPNQFSVRYKSVIVFGEIAEVEDVEKREALVGFIEKYSSDYIEKGMKYLEKDEHRTKVFKMTIKHMTGKNRK